jgi:hypothetical protein
MPVPSLFRWEVYQPGREVRESRAPPAPLARAVQYSRRGRLEGGRAARVSG